MRRHQNHFLCSQMLTAPREVCEICNLGFEAYDVPTLKQMGWLLRSSRFVSSRHLVRGSHNNTMQLVKQIVFL